MTFGLKQNTIKKIQDCFKSNSKIEKAILYGSRAKGNYRRGSDIDLTLVGNKLEFSDLANLEDTIDNLLLPYKFDISIQHHISNPDLIDHIERVGKVFYQQPNTEAN